eukprot:3636362-Pleurochrysis_carterae.AAC.1
MQRAQAQNNTDTNAMRSAQECSALCACSCAKRGRQQEHQEIPTPTLRDAHTERDAVLRACATHGCAINPKHPHHAMHKTASDALPACTRSAHVYASENTITNYQYEHHMMRATARDVLPACTRSARARL